MKKDIVAQPSSDKHTQLTILSDEIIKKQNYLSINLDNIITFDIVEPELLEAVEKYTDTLQYLWEFAKDLNLNGFCEICTFISDNIFECSFKSKSEKKLLFKQLNLWPQLVLEYLLSPDSGTKDIITYICQDNWPIHVSRKHANNISVQLTKDYTIGIIKTKNAKSPKQENKIPQENETSIQEIASELSSKQIEQAINADKIIASEEEAPKNLY
ncbi:MAG: hypothetical protein IMF12_05335, partial [Proteobacteria bacterium]|nr:hypothetical protein [Pseudomonadota bacterium]